MTADGSSSNPGAERLERRVGVPFRAAAGLYVGTLLAAVERARPGLVLR